MAGRYVSFTTTAYVDVKVNNKYFDSFVGGYDDGAGGEEGGVRGGEVVGAKDMRDFSFKKKKKNQENKTISQKHTPQVSIKTMYRISAAHLDR